MVVIYTHWWSLLTVVILEVALVLANDAPSNNETTGDLALQVVSVSSTVVNVQWNCISKDNIALTWKATADNGVETWCRKDKKVFELCQTANVSQNVEAVITDLEEGMEYQLSIGEPEKPFNFKTLTSVPSGPPIYLRGHPINQAGLQISWSRPKLLDCNGDILQYNITIDNGFDEHSYIVNVSDENTRRECKDIECMSHNFTVSELIPHKKYSVKVAAVNVNGTGPFSNPIAVMSGDNKPGPPGPPENLRVINSGEESDEFILQWDMPRNPNGVIKRYKIEYGIINKTNVNNYTTSTNYTLHLLNNETYTIAVYAENSIGLGRGVQIQWSLSDDSSSDSNKNKDTYTYIIIGNSVGAFILILAICIAAMCIRSRCRKSSNSPSRSKSTQFYPAEVTTAVNLGYIYAERGSNSLPYDYPYIEANGAQASSTTTFQIQNATKSANRNSTCTCGYIEMSSMLNGNVRPNSASHLASDPSSIISNHTAAAPSLSNSASVQYVNANDVPASQNDARAVLSPPADGNGGSANANTHSDNGYVTLHS